MSFPDSRAPTSRTLNLGSWPVKVFRANNGAETRRLYGSLRTNVELELTYENIPDAQANEFRSRYDDAKGEFNNFDLPAIVYQGWTSAGDTFSGPRQNSWRYKGPPTITSVKPGISTVNVTLISVFRQ